MSSLFCCEQIRPYRPAVLSHEAKFTAFMAWAAFPRSTDPTTDTSGRLDVTFAVQLVRQVNFGPLEAKRYFVPDGQEGAGFVEVQERDLIEANFQKLNTYKNWKCEVHNKFFEVNIYQKDPVNKHHWRANIARPAGDIDL